MRLLFGLIAALGVLLAACSGSATTDDGRSAPGDATRAPAALDSSTAQPTLQPDDVVNLTVYLRAGEGANAHLEPVTREVEVGQDLPRRAMELLLAGPTPDESNLKRPLPTGAQLRDLHVEGGTATVSLSPEAIRAAQTIGASPTNEVLALGAIANTLTEFPSIDHVVLNVSGQGIKPGEFWGGWGLPAVLVRDESLIGTAGEDGEGVLDVKRFTDETQTVGSSDATGVEVTSIRTRDRLTYVRLMLEVVDPDRPDSAAAIPRTRARRSGDEIVLDISRVGRYSSDLGDGAVLDLSDQDFDTLAVEERDGTLVLRLRVTDAAERGFWLHTLSSPARIVLDVKKTAARVAQS